MINSRMVVYPYKMGSTGAKEISKRLGALRVWPDRKYRPRSGDIVINWGNGKTPRWGHRIINKPENVRIATNKLLSLNRLEEHGVPHVPYTENTYLARNWSRVVERHVLNGSCGEGIKIVSGSEVSPAPLYTEFIDADREYRVHVFGGKVIDYQLKRKKNGVENIGIRNHENGWIFSREYSRQRDDVKDVAIRAVRALGLDFGAVDLVRRGKEVMVLEVNTAPGIVGKTIDFYENAIKNYKNPNE